MELAILIASLVLYGLIMAYFTLDWWKGTGGPK